MNSDAGNDAETRVVGGGGSAVAGVTLSGWYGFVLVEAGYRWTSSMTAANQALDYRGPIVQATLGLSLL